MTGPSPIETLPSEKASALRAVLFDIDDTITHEGLLVEEAYSALWALRRSGLAAIPVTGRPAGWCDLIARQWPVRGVIGENGAFAFYMNEGHLERLFHPRAPDPAVTKGRLSALADRALSAFPGLRVAKDQSYRLFDLALDFAEEAPDLGLDLARRVKDFCESAGARAKVSSIHVNAWYGDYDKLSMTELFVGEMLGLGAAGLDETVCFFGDSPNDEPMFRRFPLSCGVANVLRYGSLLRCPPAYITKGSYGYGFAEGVAEILNLRAKSGI